MNHRRYWLLLCTLYLLLLLGAAGCTGELPAPTRYVTLVADGQQQRLETTAETVRDILGEAGLALNPLDYVIPPETARLTAGMTVTVTRVLQHLEVYTETLPFGRQTIRDATVAAGESRLIQSGKVGLLERTYRITQEDGREVERALVEETVVEAPRDEMFLIGTRPVVQTVPISGTLVYLSHQDAWSLYENNRAPRRLTTLGDLDGRVFTLSPQGDRLLFSRAITDAAHINALWLIRTAEADPNPIPLTLNDVLWADWAPDSLLTTARIAWTTAEPAARAPGWRGQNDLWTATLNERNVLTTRREILKPASGGGFGWWGTRYAWNPTGEALAYSRPDSVGVVDLGKAQDVVLVTFSAYQTRSSWAWNPTIAWDPAGQFIAAVIHGPSADNTAAEDSPVFDSWLLAANGAYSAEVASEVGMWANPSFHPDGETMLFGRAVVPYQSVGSAYRLCLSDRDGSNARCIYPPDAEPGIETPTWQWSPDGQAVVFIQRGDLYLLPLATEAAFPLTDAGAITLFAWR
ncbi:MAG TPA: G5 domain-containing protein [Anaerolineae bacterium]|nr:G5 domain-containing protein [Anaerolineae bacterium]